VGLLYDCTITVQEVEINRKIEMTHIICHDAMFVGIFCDCTFRA